MTLCRVERVSPHCCCQGQRGGGDSGQASGLRVALGYVCTEKRDFCRWEERGIEASYLVRVSFGWVGPEPGFRFWNVCGAHVCYVSSEYPPMAVGRRRLQGQPKRGLLSGLVD